MEKKIVTFLPQKIQGDRHRIRKTQKNFVISALSIRLVISSLSLHFVKFTPHYKFVNHTLRYKFVYLMLRYKFGIRLGSRTSLTKVVTHTPRHFRDWHLSA